MFNSGNPMMDVTQIGINPLIDHPNVSQFMLNGPSMYGNQGDSVLQNE